MTNERRKEIALALLSEAHRSGVAPHRLIERVAASLGSRREPVASLFWEMVESRYLDRCGRPLVDPAEAAS